MQEPIRTIATRLLIASTLLSPIGFSSAAIAQDRQRRTTDESDQQKTWPADQASIVKKASESKEPVQLSSEPVMRIALSTDSHSATISTTASLLNASEAGAQPLPLDTSRLRVESRMLSPSRPSSDRAFDLDVARSLSRDEADRIVGQVRELAGVEARPVAESADKWKVVVRSQSTEEADDLTAKLEDAGFEVLLSGQATGPKGPAPVANDAKDISSATNAKAPAANRVRLTSRAIAPGRELIEAIAARTYALKNRGQFSAEGYDLLPTTRSQVYRGLSSETVLTSRAVEETRGMIATYNGEPINALYTSTCGGRTEDAENIFNTAVPYLKGRECAAEGKAAFAPFMIRSSRELFDIKDERDLVFARDAAVLAISGFAVPADKVSSSWLSSHLSSSEAREWLTVVARLARNIAFRSPDDAVKPPAFSTALIAAVYGDARADTLLNNADADYLLGFHDGDQIPAVNRADVAMLLRDGALSLFADATLRPNESMSRARALHAIARLLESRNLLALQKGTSRAASGGIMMLRSNKGKDLPIVVNREVFLFREFGDNLFQMKSLALVGAEPVVFHVNSKGEVDYLEVRPAANGAAADRFSSVTNWTAELSLSAVQSRLGRSVRGVGAITDLHIAARGSSRRVIDLEVVGTQGVGHIRGGRIRSALGLKEQLFVIDRVYNENDRVAGFVFTGRGWGHGVGMCQFGAYGLAKQGFTVDQILKTYYTGIELTKMYN